MYITFRFSYRLQEAVAKYHIWMIFMSQFSPIFMNSISHVKWQDQEWYRKKGVWNLLVYIKMTCLNFFAKSAFTTNKFFIKWVKEIGIVLYIS